MTIRNASLRDFDRIFEIYSEARSFMAESGNPDQWGAVYPPRELILSDIEEASLYVVEEAGDLLGVFYFSVGEDECYREIYDGEWLSPSAPYGVVHRVATSKIGRGRGVAATCFEWCFSKIPNIKIDTHRENLPMQRALCKCGFSRRGIIYLPNGEERIAYQKIK